MNDEFCTECGCLLIDATEVATAICNACIDEQEQRQADNDEWQDGDE